jgi:hypothetical protein
VPLPHPTPDTRPSPLDPLPPARLTTGIRTNYDRKTPGIAGRRLGTWPAG